MKLVAGWSAQVPHEPSVALRLIATSGDRPIAAYIPVDAPPLAARLSMIMGRWGCMVMPRTGAAQSGCSG